MVTRAEKLSKEIKRVINYFATEYNLTYVEAIGTLKIITDELSRKASNQNNNNEVVKRKNKRNDDE